MKSTVKSLLKYILIFIYITLVSYAANELVFRDVMSKNLFYAVSTTIIKLVGVLLLFKVFKKYNPKK